MKEARMSFCPFCNRMNCDHVPRLIIAPGEEGDSDQESNPSKRKELARLSVPTTDVGFGQ